MSKISDHLGETLRKHVEKHKPKEKAKKKEVRHFHIEPREKANGKMGYDVETHFGHDGDEYYEPQKEFHDSLHSVHQHMKSCCEGMDKEDV